MIETHTHDFRDLDFRTFTVTATLPGTLPATAANYEVVSTVHRPCELIRVTEVHRTAGSVSGTLQVEKLTGTQALDGGVNMLASTISLTSTANTVVKGTLTTTRRDRILSQDDRVALKDGGDLTSVAGLTVVLEFLLLDNI